MSPILAALIEEKEIITGPNEILHSEMEVNLLSPKEQRSRYFLMCQRNLFLLANHQPFLFNADYVPEIAKEAELFT